MQREYLVISGHSHTYKNWLDIHKKNQYPIKKIQANNNKIVGMIILIKVSVVNQTRKKKLGSHRIYNYTNLYEKTNWVEMLVIGSYILAHE